MTGVPLDEVQDILTADDRCDRCNAQAYVLVILPEDMCLTFCSHHWNEHSDRLIEAAVDVIDETDRLERK